MVILGNRPRALSFEEFKEKVYIIRKQKEPEKNTPKE